MPAKNLVSCLKTLLADSFTMYLTAHGYHWNVEGPDFSQYHGLFSDIYEDVYSSVDPIAENIRKLDEYAPFTLAKFTALRTVEAKDVQPNPKSMAKALLTMNEGVLGTIDEAFKCAIKENQQGIANFLSERDDMHKKWAWQLRSSLK